MVMERFQGESKRYLARMAGFYLSVLAFVFFWLLAFNFHLYAVFAGWFDPALSDTIHFVHDIALATWVWVWGAAMVVQLYKPARRITAMQVALVMSVVDLGLGLVAPPLFGAGPPRFDPSALLFFGPIFAAAALHPTRRELLTVRGFDRSTVDPMVLGLAALAGVPVVLYVLGQVNFQLTVPDEHAEFGHYATMGYYGLSLLGLGILASLRNRGRRFAAYGAGLLALMLAVASVFQPTTSGLNTTWATLAVLWGLALVGAYEWSVRRDTSRVPVTPGERTKASP